MYVSLPFWLLLRIFLPDLDLSLRLDQLRPKERQWWAEQPAGTTGAAQFCPWLTNEMNRKLMLTRTAVDKDVVITDCELCFLTNRKLQVMSTACKSLSTWDLLTLIRVHKRCDPNTLTAVVLLQWKPLL